MEQCNYNEKVTNLTNNDFTLGSRLKGEIVIDANTVLGIGTFAYVVLAGSANMPTNHNYIITNSVDVSTGNFTQFATPTTSNQGRMAYRTNTNNVFSPWVLIANTNDVALDGVYAKIDGSNSTGALLDSINKRHDAVTLGANSNGLILTGQVLQFASGYQLPTTIALSQYDEAFLMRHSHANKSVLDSIVNKDISQWINDAGYLQSNDLDGFIYDVTYNSAAHTITFYQQNEPNIVIDLPIEQLIKGVSLVGNDLVFTFEDGSTVTVPLNTLLVGVVKSVNSLTPNSQGEIILNVTDIPNLSSELANKLDIRMTGLVSNLTQPEKDAIHTKLGITNNVTQVLGLSGNTLSLSGGGGSVNLGIVNIGGLQAALDLKADISQIGNGNISYAGTGSITGGGTSTANQSGNTNYSFDLTSQTKTDIGLGVTANSWGNHANMGYLTSFTETDPIFIASVAYGITSADITNWNSKTSNLGTVTSITAGTGLSGGTITTSGTIALNSATLASLALADTALQVETDPIFIVSPAYGITAGNISDWNAKQSALTNGLHTTLSSNQINVEFEVNTPVIDKSGNTRLIFGNTQSTDIVIHGAVANGDFKIKDSTGTDTFRIIGSSKVPQFPQLPAQQTMDGNIAIFDTGNSLWKHTTKISDLVTQAYLTTQLNFKANTVGNNLSNIPQWKASLGFLDSSDLIGYATEAWANGRFSLLGHTHPINDVVGLQNTLDSKVENFENTIGIGFVNGDVNEAPYFYHDSGNVVPLATQNYLYNYLNANYDNVVRYGAIGSQNNPVRFGWDNSDMLAQVDNTIVGKIAFKDWVQSLIDGRALLNGSNLTNIPNWQSVLGINTSWNLQQVMNNGNTSTIPLDLMGLYLAGSVFYSDSIFEFKDRTNGSVQKVLTGGLLASDSYADASLIPANGIYAKGNILSGATITASQFIANNGGLIINGTGGVNANTTKIFFNNVNASIGWAISQGINNVTQDHLSFGTWDGSTYTNKVRFEKDDGNIRTEQFGSADQWIAKVTNMENAIGIGFSNGNFNDAPYFYHNVSGYRFLATQEWSNNNFVSSAALGNYVNKAGDTMIGGLNLPLAQLIGNDTFLKIGKTLSVTTGDISNWTFANRNDTLFGEHVNDLSFWGDRVGGYYVPLIFRNNGDVILASSKNAISGNAGIGTTNPQAKLHVNGNAIVADATASNHAVAFGQLANYALNSSLANYALLSQVPTNNNQLANGANYTTLAIVQGWIGTQGFTNTTVGANGSNYTSGAISINQGTGVTVTKSGNTITVSATGSGGGGITNIATDDPNMPGPTASNMPIVFNSHVAYGKPETAINDEEVGNGQIQVTSGDNMRFHHSFDNVMTFVEDAGKQIDIDTNEIRKHICNVVFTPAVGTGGTVTFTAGIYTGDQINITVPRGQGINLQPQGGINLISSSGQEIYTHANLIWDAKIDSWVLVSYE